MTDTPTLRIDHSRDPSAMTATYCLSGDIDVNAAQAFAPLHDDPPAGCRAVLDFAQVQRVNSMGLAQLLRLLEAWNGSGIRMEARAPNRTVSMLFKMTGMNRYFDADAAAAAPTLPAAAPTALPRAATAAPGAGQTAGQTAAPALPRANPPQLRRVVRSIARPPAQEPGVGSPAPAATVAPTSPLPAAAAAAGPAGTPTPAGAKLAFTVSLQSSHQLTGWYYLNTLLQRTLERAMSLDIRQLGSAETPDDASLPALAFARPFEACALMSHHGYLPVARPQDDTDEVCIVVRHNEPRQDLTEFGGAQVATASARSFVFLLGRFCCDEYGLPSAPLQYQFTGSEITALRALVRGQSDLLFMLQRNYHQLAALSRADTRVLHESETGMAYHMLLLHPDQAVLLPALQQALLTLGDSDKGRQALQDLGMSAWTAPRDDEIAMLQMLYQRYAPA
jgi:anti-anti-sigma factor